LQQICNLTFFPQKNPKMIGYDFESLLRSPLQDLRTDVILMRTDIVIEQCVIGNMGVFHLIMDYLMEPPDKSATVCSLDETEETGYFDDVQFRKNFSLAKTLLLQWNVVEMWMIGIFVGFSIARLRSRKYSNRSDLFHDLFVVRYWRFHRDGLTEEMKNEMTMGYYNKYRLKMAKSFESLCETDFHTFTMQETRAPLYDTYCSENDLSTMLRGSFDVASCSLFYDLRVYGGEEPHFLSTLGVPLWCDMTEFEFSKHMRLVMVVMCLFRLCISGNNEQIVVMPYLVMAIQDLIAVIDITITALVAHRGSTNLDSLSHATLTRIVRYNAHVASAFPIGLHRLIRGLVGHWKGMPCSYITTCLQDASHGAFRQTESVAPELLFGITWLSKFKRNPHHAAIFKSRAADLLCVSSFNQNPHLWTRQMPWQPQIVSDYHIAATARKYPVVQDFYVGGWCDIYGHDTAFLAINFSLMNVKDVYDAGELHMDRIRDACWIMPSANYLTVVGDLFIHSFDRFGMCLSPKTNRQSPLNFTNDLYDRLLIKFTNASRRTCIDLPPVSRLSQIETITCTCPDFLDGTERMLHLWTLLHGVHLRKEATGTIIEDLEMVLRNYSKVYDHADFLTSTVKFPHVREAIIMTYCMQRREIYDQVEVNNLLGTINTQSFNGEEFDNIMRRWIDIRNAMTHSGGRLIPEEVALEFQ
jgi:hypothetical protein